MPVYPMTTTIAERVFEYRGPDGVVALTAVLGQPARMPDSDDDWYCPWRITAAGVERQMYAGGVDGMQALLCALTGLRADLVRFARDGKLTFLDGEDLMMEPPRIDA